MSALRIPLLMAALTLATPAPASVAMTLGDALLARPMLVRDSLDTAAATQRYFDVDALLTLGALALAGGTLAAAARRPRAVSAAATRRSPVPAPTGPALQPRDAA